MSAQTSVFTWIRQHMLISLGVLLALGLLLWGVKPAFFAATHASMQDCGSLYSGMLSPTALPANPSATQAFKCFVLAHQQCRAASLSYTSHSVDTGITEVYYTANGIGNCELSGKSTPYGILGNRTTTAFRCSATTQELDGLHLHSCEQYGEIVVPASAAKA